MKFKSEQTEQKLRGGYYTPLNVAMFLSKFAVNLKTRNVLEPSCGDGIFFEALEKIQPTIQIDAVEIDNEASKNAKKLGQSLKLKLNLTKGDFLDEGLQVNKNTYDAVIGNPPYIRYQFLDSKTQERSSRVFALASLTFTKHTNLWVTFVIAAVQRLNNSGRLAMIVPSEILNVLHPGQLRKYLLSECSKILIIDSQELVFAEALQGTVLLLAQKKSSNEPQPSAKLAIQYEKNLDFLKKSPLAIFKTADYVATLISDDKWMLPLLTAAEREVIARVTAMPAVKQFGDIAKIEVGMVTGANNFFLVSDETIKNHSLNSYSLPMVGRSQHLRGVLYDKKKHAENKKLNLPVNYIDFPHLAKKHLEMNLLKYVEIGESSDLHLRYKTRIRDPWYVVPSKWAPQLFLLKRSYSVPRVIVNEIGALNTDTAYRVSTEKDPVSFAYSFYNSLTAISAELEGRSYGGGVLELVPSEVRRLVIPFITATRQQIEELDSAIEGNISTNALLAMQDEIVLKQIGLSNLDIANIQKARIKLQSRRFRVDEPVDSLGDE
jgi:adenine-specific DNA-methyltransferase